jgi:hypothetical protein
MVNQSVSLLFRERMVFRERIRLRLRLRTRGGAYHTVTTHKIPTIGVRLRKPIRRLQSEFIKPALISSPPATGVALQFGIRCEFGRRVESASGRDPIRRVCSQRSAHGNASDELSTQ